MSVTIRDVAKACNVSTFTVSSVLNNKRNIKEETRQKVQDAMRRLQYNPLRNIPFLRQTKTKTVGLVLPLGMYEMSPFYHRAILAAQRVLSAQGHTCAIFSEADVERAIDAAFAPGTPRLHCDGVVCFCPNSDYNRYLDVLRTWRTPAVLINRTTTVAGVTTIRSENYAGARLLLEHVAGRGHTRIGLVHVEHVVFMATEARQAFVDFTLKRGATDGECPILALPPDDGQAMRDLVTRLLRLPQPPTALFCYDDQLAAWCLSELARAGVRVPQQITVVGFGDDPPSATLAPPLSTIHLPVEEMVAEACRLLVEQPAEYGRPTDIRFPCRLVERDSVAAPLIPGG